MSQPVDELLGALPEVGLRLHNLFQLGDGWQANVRASDGDPCFEFGRGATPAQALVAALKAAGVKVEHT